MPKYLLMDKAELNEEYKKLSDTYAEYKAQGLSLNMARGKPGEEQLNISNDMLYTITPETVFQTADWWSFRIEWQYPTPHEPRNCSYGPDASWQ